MSEQTFAESVRESRIFYRRQLAQAMTVALLRRRDAGIGVTANPAAYVEDFANAVTERLAAREEAELTSVVRPEYRTP